VTGPLGFFIAALLGILSFPPIGLWPFAYVALVPFLISSVSLSPGRALWWGYGSGFVFFSGLLYWLGLNSGAPPSLAWASVTVVILVLSSVWSIVAWAVSKAARRFGLVVASVLFVSLYMYFEVFWGTGELGFPWAVWGLSQSTFLPAIQLADLGDIYGISLWVLVVNVLIFLWIRQPAPRRKRALLTVLVLFIPMIYGLVKLVLFRPGEPIPVAAVQANTPVDDKWQMAAEDIAQSYLDTSRPLSGTGTRLVVWPETATPTALRYRPWLRTALYGFCDSTGMSLLTGATDYENDPDKGMQPYNAAFLIQPHTTELLHSAKIHLVPFGERIPWQSTFPFLGKLHLGQAEWVPGKDVVVFPLNNGIPPMGCLICFEVVFPDIAADMVRGGARILTTITNDGWYGNSSGPYQHLHLAQIRAVATRRSVVRSANTGISALILPTGEIRESLGYDRPGFVQGVVPAQTEITLAVRLAHLWPVLYTVQLLVVLAYMLIRARRMNRPGGASA
jgi:apolipoprotein N-acyltransferase